MRTTLYSSLVLFLLISPAHSQHMNEKDSPCAGIAVTSDLVGCLWKARTSTEGQHNAFYKKVFEKLRVSPDDVGRLRKAERLWSQYRDANCSAERELYGRGTGAPPAYLACMESMTRARTRELQIVYGWVMNK